LSINLIFLRGLAVCRQEGLGEELAAILAWLQERRQAVWAEGGARQRSGRAWGCFRVNKESKKG